MTDKISIQDLTAAIDLGARDLWDSFTPEQHKQVSFYVLNRFASSIKTNNRDIQELAVLKTNEYYNKNYFALTRHPRLQWHLLCMTGHSEKKVYFHEWIGFKKSGDGNRALNILEHLFPDIKSDELELLAKITSIDDLKQYALDLGLTDEEIKKLFK